MWQLPQEVAREPCLLQVHPQHQVEVQPQCRLEQLVLQLPQLRQPEMDQLCRRPQWEDRCPLDLLQGMRQCVEHQLLLGFHPQRQCLGALRLQQWHILQHTEPAD